MLARAAEWNPSLFRKEGKVEMNEVIREYLKLCVLTDNPFSNTKYTVQNILKDLQGREFLAAQTFDELW